MGGFYVTDIVTVAPLLNATTFKFIDATTVTDGQSDGIIGLGLPAGLSGVQGDSFLVKMQSQHRLTSSVFSWYLDRTGKSGEIVFGGIDSSRYIGKLAWAPVWNDGSGFWQSIMYSTTVGANKISSTSNQKIVFDTGTEIVYAYPQIARDINLAIGAKFNQSMSQGMGVDV